MIINLEKSSILLLIIKIILNSNLSLLILETCLLFINTLILIRISKSIKISNNINNTKIKYSNITKLTKIIKISEENYLLIIQHNKINNKIILIIRTISIKHKTKINNHQINSKL